MVLKNASDQTKESQCYQLKVIFSLNIFCFSISIHVNYTTGSKSIMVKSTIKICVAGIIAAIPFCFNC